MSPLSSARVLSTLDARRFSMPSICSLVEFFMSATAVSRSILVMLAIGHRKQGGTSVRYRDWEKVSKRRQTRSLLLRLVQSATEEERRPPHDRPSGSTPAASVDNRR